eukprot:jgi/Psemu1/44143/gm1.44143_g
MSRTRWAVGGNDDNSDKSGVVDLVLSVDSPVDMCTSPRSSPSTQGGNGSGRTANHHPMLVRHSPFYTQLKNSQQHSNNNCTVQSNNPFSSMIFDSKKPSRRTTTAVASKLLSMVPGNSLTPWKDNGEDTMANTTTTTAATLGLGHPLLLTMGSLSNTAASSQTKPHLALRSKLQKQGSPCHLLVVDASGSNIIAGNSNSNSNNTCLKEPTHDGTGYRPLDSFLDHGLGKDPTRKTSFAKTSGSSEAFTVDNVNHKNHNHNHLASPSAPQAPPEDFCTNIHKVWRRSKGDDVVAVAAQGEPTWKKKVRYIRTNPSARASASANPPNHHSNQNPNNPGF